MNLQGILPAVVTPVDIAGVFQPAAFEQLVHRLYAAGVDGLYVCGQTGEGLQQTAAQREAVTEAAVRFSPPGKTVIVHIGAGSTAEAEHLAIHAAAAGAHAISSLPPLGSYSFPEIHEYYRTLAAATPIPLIVYFFPELSGGISNLDRILDLCAIPNVAGLKFTHSDLFQVERIKQKGHVVFNGSDEMLAPGLLAGADGGIGSTYNLMPDHFVSLYQSAKHGDWVEARGIQTRINDVIQVLLRFPINAAIKALLRTSGIDCGDCIPPRRSLTSAEQEDLRARLALTEIGRILITGRP